MSRALVTNRQAAFQTAKDAVAAAVDAQRDLFAHPWPAGAEVKVRMRLHTGEPRVGDDRYVGIGVHRAARIGAAAHGGQVVLSWTTKGLAEEDLPPGVTICDLGERRLKDIEQPQHLYRLVIEGLHASGDYEMSLGAGNRHRRQPGRPLTTFLINRGSTGARRAPVAVLGRRRRLVVNAHGCGVHG